MSKYIDAEAFKRRILYYGTVHEKDRIPIPFYKRYFAEAYVAILRWICEEVDDTPAADVVEVIRCKDCKHRDAEKGFCEGRGWPMQLVPDDGFATRENGRQVMSDFAKDTNVPTVTETSAHETNKTECRAMSARSRR